MSDIVVSRIKADDWQKYRGLRLKALLEEPTAFSTNFEEERNMSDDEWIAKVSSYALSEHTRVYVAYEGEELHGMMGIKFETTAKRRHIGTVFGVYVARSARGRGISKRLMNHLLAEVREVEYIRKIKLTVNVEQENARNLYKSFGFREVGKMEHEFKLEDGYADIIMMEVWKDDLMKKELKKEAPAQQTKFEIKGKGKSWLKSLMGKLSLRN